MLAQSAERQRVRKCRAGDGEFRAPARVTFFFCKKKVTKENHLDLRSKGPLARCGSCRFGGADLAELVRWGSLSVRGIACTSCAAAADAVRVGAGALIVFGDYQIAPIAARSTAMGRWRLTPPGYGGRRLRAGRGSFTPLRGYTSSAPFGDTFPSRGRLTGVRPPGEPVSLRVGRSAGLTGHRRVIQHCGPIKGEGLGDKKKRPGALLLALFISFCLFISFWWCRSGPSGTGSTGRRRGLRRGRRSWGPRWAAPRAGRSSSRRFGVFPPTWPADAGDASPAY